MSATGRGAIRSQYDFYATPKWTTEAILPKLNYFSSILDPAAGRGAIMLSALGWHPGARVFGFELNVDDCLFAESQFGLTLQCRNSLSDHPWRDADGSRFSTILGNPPFSLAMEFVERSLHEIHPAGQVVMLLRLGFLESLKRASFHKKHPADIYALPKRPSFTGGGTDASAYSWFVWGPGRGGRWEILDVEPQSPRVRK